MPRHPFIPIFAPLALAVALTGCTRTTVEHPLTTDYAAADVDQEVAFWHQLPERSAVTNDEGLHALMVFANGSDPHTGYAARMAAAKSAGWLSGGFNEPANMTMTRGNLAAGLASILKLKGGLMMRLTGINSRTATHELVYNGVLPEDSTEWQTFSGLELLGVMARATDMQNALREAGKPNPDPASTPGQEAQPSPPSPPPSTSTVTPAPAPSASPAAKPSQPQPPAPVPVPAPTPGRPSLPTPPAPPVVPPQPK